jgi:hypothetical protein
MVWCTDSGGSAQLGFVDVVDLRSLQTGQNIQCGGRAYRQTSLVDRLSDYQSSKSRCSVVCVRTSLPDDDRCLGPTRLMFSSSVSIRRV